MKGADDRTVTTFSGGDLEPLSKSPCRLNSVCAAVVSGWFGSMCDVSALFYV